MQYHAHIYFKLDEANQAQALYAQAKGLPNAPFTVWRLFTKNVGPHPLPMFEIHFNDQTRAQAVEWIENHRGHFSVLVHEDTGDDHRDHTTNVRWLGTPLPIDFSFFEKLKTQPELTIHVSHPH